MIGCMVVLFVHEHGYAKRAAVALLVHDLIVDVSIDVVYRVEECLPAFDATSLLDEVAIVFAFFLGRNLMSAS